MCVLSNVIDDFSGKWDEYRRIKPHYPNFPPFDDSYWKDFNKKIKEATEQDKREGNPDCGTKEKVDKLLSLAREFGIEDKVKQILKEALGLE